MLAPLRSNPQRKMIAVGKSVPAPVQGWDAVSPLSNMDPARAITLDNWFPQPGYVEVRKGNASHGTGMGSSTPVESLMVYNALVSTSNKMFAAASTVIYDVTIAGAGSSSLTSLTSARWRYVNYTTSANVAYLWICNGSDDPRHWNGSAWATPSITGVTGADTVNINVFKKYIWGVLKNSMDAYYLPLDSVAGAAVKFPLGSVLSQGGYLVAMGTWSRDAGDGLDDLAVFISSRGQIAVYSGTNPASDFALIGVFNIAPPIGFKCFVKVGADLAIITTAGILPISKALSQDRAAEVAIAITLRINNAMNMAAQSYKGNFGWELTPFPTATMTILNVPIAENNTAYQYVMNTLTGAWCRFTGWNFNCFAMFNDLLYAGTNTGTVQKCWTGSIDGSTLIDAVCQQAYNYFGERGSQKHFTAIQPMITTDQTVAPSLGVSTDFQDNADVSTPSSVSTNSALYDSAIYDTDVYAVEGRSSSDWTTVSGIGQCAAVHFRASTSSTGSITIKWNGCNIVYEQSAGGLY